MRDVPGHFGDRRRRSLRAGGTSTTTTPTTTTSTGCSVASTTCATAPIRHLRIPDAFHVVFCGNVSLTGDLYSPGESAMAAIQEAVDAEFPAFANVYCDRLGRLRVHGRYARFDPLGTEAATAGWDFHDWKAGDGAAVAASPTDTAHIRGFTVTRDLDKIINYALATPKSDRRATTSDANRRGTDLDMACTGSRPWTTQNLLDETGRHRGFAASGRDQPLRLEGDEALRQVLRGQLCRPAEPDHARSPSAP